jgi:hypothetical protein
MRTTKKQREVILQCVEDPENFALIEGKKNSAPSSPSTCSKLLQKTDGLQRMAAVVNSAFPGTHYMAKLVKNL